MLQYLRNIIPRIQQFSEQLSHIEVFVDKPWVLIDEQENTHEYVFLRDKRLILSLNGKVIVGSWELLPTGKLLINRVTDNILLQQAFIDEGILLLKQSGTQDLPFLLLNEKIISDKDPLKYLQKVEAKKLNYTLYKTEDGLLLNNSNSSSGKFDIGATLRFDNGVKVNGTLQSTEIVNQYISCFEGVIQEIFYIKEYVNKNSQNVKLKFKDPKKLKIGDCVVNYKDFPSMCINDLTFSPSSIDVETYKRIYIDENGVIVKFKIDNTALYGAFSILGGMIILVCVILIVKTYSNQNNFPDSTTEPEKIQNNTPSSTTEPEKVTIDTAKIDIIQTPVESVKDSTRK